MSLPHILLGLLDEPASGYDLKRIFENALRHFWAANLSQIYPTLKSLEEKGWLEVSEAPSEKGPSRRVYRRTTSGTDVLTEWLGGGPEIGTERLTWVAQVFMLSAVDEPLRQLQFMKKLRDAMVERLAALESAEAHWKSVDPRYPDDLPDKAFYRHLTLRLGLSRMAGNLRWCEECIGRIEKRSVVTEQGI